MDSYQAIYDAVRSRIPSCDLSGLADRIAIQFDFSHHAAIAAQEISCATYEHQRPSVLFRPVLTIDGNQWCALYGDNLQDGVAGFGDSPANAMHDFDKNWQESLTLIERK